MSIETDLKVIAKEIDAFLDLSIEVPIALEAVLFESMRYSILGGGKRLRPYLVVACADMFRVKRDSSIRVAAAVEMVHAYSLVHDDLPCMDDDDLRRGRATTHIRFDEPTAVLTGDALLTQAFGIIANPKTHKNAEIRAELICALSHAVGAKGMCGGQMMDLLAKSRLLGESDITRLQTMKTGALLAFCCQAGAILGCAGEKDRQSLKRYTDDIGLSFQIVDDLLDIEGSEEMVGKRVGKDTASGKATFVSVLGLAGARKRSQLLTERAIAEVRGQFGNQGQALEAVASFIVSRSW